MAQQSVIDEFEWSSPGEGTLGAEIRKGSSSAGRLVTPFNIILNEQSRVGQPAFSFLWVINSIN